MLKRDNNFVTALFDYVKRAAPKKGGPGGFSPTRTGGDSAEKSNEKEDNEEDEAGWEFYDEINSDLLQLTAKAPFTGDFQHINIAKLFIKMLNLSKDDTKPF